MTSRTSHIISSVRAQVASLRSERADARGQRSHPLAMMLGERRDASSCPSEWSSVPISSSASSTTTRARRRREGRRSSPPSPR